MGELIYDEIKLQLSVLSGEKMVKLINYVASGVTLYFNAQHLLIKLNNKERCFFDFLCEKMREVNNDIVIDKHLKALFIEHIEKIGKVDMAEDQVNKYASKLSSLGLLLETESKARYTVNPKYVFKGSNSKRRLFLRELILQRLGKHLSIDKLLDVPAADFANVTDVA